MVEWGSGPALASVGVRPPGECFRPEETVVRQVVYRLVVEPQPSGVKSFPQVILERHPVE